jgi:hypothetical protein
MDIAPDYLEVLRMETPLSVITRNSDSEMNHDSMAMNEDSTSLISYILEQRRPYLQWLQGAKTYLDGLSAELSGLLQFKREVEADPFFGVSLTEMNFEELAGRLKERRALLDVLGRRFDRKTLNIAVVGLANQGKSFLLRTLTGLPQSVIPDRNNEHDQLEPLTGARSTIYHRNGSKVSGKVIFHSEESILEILNKYRETIKGSILNAPPVFDNEFSSIDTFAQTHLPAESKNSGSPAKYNVLLKELYKYQELISHSRKYIGHEPLDDLSEEDLSGFITQANGKKAGDKKYLYLAVKEVQIACSFPHDDVGEVSLIDLPGLGEATLGGPERLMTALKWDADIALFVWRPTVGTLVESNEFIELYDTCFRALEKILPLQEWSFLALNHHREINNYEICEGVLDKIANKQVSYSFFAESICDCSSREEVKEKILNPVLHHLAKHIGVLDRKLARTSFEDIQAISKDTAMMLQKLRESFGGTSENWDEVEFGKLFREKWEELQRGFNNLTAALMDRADSADESFQHKVENTLTECGKKDWLPTVDELQKEVEARRFDKVLIDQMLWARAHLSAKLSNLDMALDQPLEAVKAEVAKVLIAAGGFSNITQDSELVSLSEAIATSASPLRAAFESLLAFRLSGRGLIGRKVRAALQTLEPRRNWNEEALIDKFAAPGKEQAPELQPQKKVNGFTPANDHHRQTTAQAELAQKDAGAKAEAVGARQIRDMLDKITTKTLGDIEKTLSQDYSVPNQTAYAIVADFVDSIVYARNIEDQWRDIYRHLRAKVWPDNYKLQILRQRHAADLLALVEKADRVVRVESLSLPV